MSIEEFIKNLTKEEVIEIVKYINYNEPRLFSRRIL